MRAAVLLLSLPIALALAAVPLGLHTPFVEAAGARVLSKIEGRLGLPVRAARIVPEGLLGVRFDDVRIGPPAAPLVTARAIHGVADGEALDRREVRPAAVQVEGPTLHIHGDGTLKGALRALKDAVPRRREGADEAPDPMGGGRRLPPLAVDDGQVLDHGGALHVVGIRVTFDNGRFTGEANIRQPPIGRCRFAGDLDAVDVVCSDPLGYELPRKLNVEGRRLRFERRPTPRVQLSGLRLSGGEEPWAALIRGLSVELAVGLEKDREGRWPIEARLRLPSGGYVSGVGSADQEGLQVRAEVERVPIGRASDSVRGALSGDVSLAIDRSERRIEVGGEARVDDLVVQNGALSDEPIGPFTLVASGELTAESPPTGPLSAMKVALRDGVVTVGTVPGFVTASYDSTGEAARMEAHVHVPRADGQKLVAALPPGLLPNLEPLTVKGTFGLKGDLVIDMARLKDTVLDVNLDIRTLKILEMNPDIDLRKLRTIFETHFEMPDGEIFVRESGPLSERWTPLDKLPALLPLAVISQEDGGFYGHKGVSLLHLRGSLVRNLEHGRFARGGSTVTMQLARNLFLNRRKTLSRKLEELVVTWQLEQALTKDQIIELYLNVVEFGPGVFGIGDAASYYFDRAPAELDALEIAYLVRLLPGPRLYHKQFEKQKLSNAYARRMERLLGLLVQRGHLVVPPGTDLSVPEAFWNERVRVPAKTPRDLEEVVPDEGLDELPEESALP